MVPLFSFWHFIQLSCPLVCLVPFIVHPACSLCTLETSPNPIHIPLPCYNSNSITTPTVYKLSDVSRKGWITPISSEAPLCLGCVSVNILAPSISQESGHTAWNSDIFLKICRFFPCLLLKCCCVSHWQLCTKLVSIWSYLQLNRQMLLELQNLEEKRLWQLVRQSLSEGAFMGMPACFWKRKLSCNERWVQETWWSYLL